MEYILEMKNIKKSYADILALEDGNLRVRPGEVHALLGENGTGKSSLMNILLGMDVIWKTGGYSGEILLEGKMVTIGSAKQAMELGIGMVHQEGLLFDGFSIAENIGLNMEQTTKTLLSKVFGSEFEKIDQKALNHHAKMVLEPMCLPLEQTHLVSKLNLAEKQLVEAAREAGRAGAKLIIFDEPTAALNAVESDRILKLMKHLAKEGKAVLFITHRLEEVKQVADHVTIIRDKKTVAEYDCKNTPLEIIAKDMLGYHLEKKAKQKRFLNKDVIVSIRDFQMTSSHKQENKVNLEIKHGEIFGFFGLSGEGKEALQKALMGKMNYEGKILADGVELKPGSVDHFIKSGVISVSEERKIDGLLLKSSIEENICISAMVWKKKFLKQALFFSLENKKKMRAWTNEMIDCFSITCDSPRQPVAFLSGGNQQKVALARALTMEPKILVLSDVTRGIDIGAKQKILDVLLKKNLEQQTTILFFSNELEELNQICDRIAIIHQNKLAAILEGTLEEEQITKLIANTVL